MRILLVDADTSLLKSYSQFIQSRREDYDCTVFGRAEDALERINQESFDLIITEVRLPGMNGFQLKKAMNNRNDETPVLFLAHEVIDGELISKHLGAAGFLRKPATGQQLLDVIDKLMTYISRFKLKREYLKPIARLLVKDGIECCLELCSDYTIGRSKSADIRLENMTASRQHAVLTRNYILPSNNSYTIINFSKNGILVNQKKILTYCRLSHGDIISFPGCEMKYLDLEREIAFDPHSTHTGDE